jgi:2-polyprenyl-3-methyl-5-hydroxy-6-metoxy-1,4-benzoquinol methylase
MTDHTQHDNEALWHYYQTEATDVFDGSQPRLDYVAREVRRRAGRSARVLTVGVGDGYLERRLRAAGYAVSALDPDSQSIAALDAEGFTAKVGVLEQVPFADAAFDVVVATEVLEHLAQAQSDLALPEIRRVLAPGGWFVGSVPYQENLDHSRVMCPHCGEVFHRWGHSRSFDESCLRRELERAFEVVRLDHRSFVSFRRRSLKRLFSAAGHWILGRFGASVAFPSIFFVARRCGR